MSKPYRPSNGSEGEWFFNTYCDRCWFDRTEDCPILAATLVYEVDDPEYPKEWVDDGDRCGRCTQFTDHEPKELPEDAGKQMRLPLEEVNP